MQDWLLLEMTDDVLDDLPAAPLASLEAMQRLRGVGDRLDERTVAIWGITHPIPSDRTPPRTPMPGGAFAGRGFVKSDLAYRAMIVIAALSGRIYDDRADGAPPEPPANFEALWADHPAVTALRGHYERYRADGNPIIYHSVDYSNGSSGGGFFAEDSGTLVGIVPFGASLVSRRNGYPGFGAMYGIDAICRESETLSCRTDRADFR